MPRRTVTVSSAGATNSTRLVSGPKRFFGTGVVPDDRLGEAVSEVFDFRPGAIIRDLELRRPIYRALAAYGHMGREDLGVKWENTDRAEALKAAVRA